MTAAPADIDPRDQPVLVIGCGVSGLTCAVRLAMTGRPVTVVARELPPETTSNVAAAFWYPYRAYPPERVTGWAQLSFLTFRRFADNPDTGITVRPAIEVFRQPAPDPWWGEALPDWRRAPPLHAPHAAKPPSRLRPPAVT